MPGNHLFDAHQGHVDRRGGSRQAGISLVFDHHERARIGNGEIHPRHAHVGPDEILPQVFSGDGGQGLMFGGVRFAQFVLEHVPHVGGRQVQGRGNDVHRPLPGELHQVFAQVGFHRPHAGRRQIVVELHFFAHHGLGLDHGFHVVLADDVQHVLIGFGGVFGIQHLAAAGADVAPRTAPAACRDWRWRGP